MPKRSVGKAFATLVSGIYQLFKLPLNLLGQHFSPFHTFSVRESSGMVWRGDIQCLKIHKSNFLPQKHSPLALTIFHLYLRRATNLTVCSLCLRFAFWFIRRRPTRRSFSLLAPCTLLSRQWPKANNKFLWLKTFKSTTFALLYVAT